MAGRSVSPVRMRARVAGTKSTAIVAPTNTVVANVTAARTERTPRVNAAAAAAMPSATGQTKLRFRFSQEARRQAIKGPTPMRKTRDRNSGTLTWLKNGAPTLTLTPRHASERSGNTVPKNTVNAAAISSTLFKRNADSRDTTESSSPCDRRASQRHATRPSAVNTTSARKLRKNTPIEPCVNAWTEAMTPERVRNVPKSVRLNVRITSEMFQSLSMRRRSWIITEWRNAVPVSHGMNAAFSTGSHAQYPPQPRTW